MRLSEKESNEAVAWINQRLRELGHHGLSASTASSPNPPTGITFKGIVGGSITGVRAEGSRIEFDNVIGTKITDVKQKTPPTRKKP